MKSLTNNKSLLKVITISTLALILTACGAKKSGSGSSDFASRVETITSSQASAYAFCNQKETVDFKFKLKAVTTSTNAVNPNQINLRLLKTPADFYVGSGTLYFWRWKAYKINGIDQTEIDPQPLYFQIINPSTGLPLNTVWQNSLKWADVVETANSWGFTTPEQFFSTVTIVVDLKGDGKDYDAIKVSQYETGTTTLKSHTDALLPLFSANPSDYAIETDGVSPRADILKALHPFNAMSMTTEQYKSASDNFCF